MANLEFHTFFKALTERFRNENDLSDFTYTALQIVPGFKEDFVRFFFPDLPTNQEISVEREYFLDSGDGQPDFVFKAETWDLIVENKIWDANYHFDQYGKVPITAEKRVFVGLIANHAVHLPPHAQHWQFRHWLTFIDTFSTKTYGDYTGVFSAYLAYVKNICNMSEFQAFKLDLGSLSALTHLARMVERALREVSGEGFKIKLKGGHKYNFGESWAGYFFELIPTGKEGKLMAFFGLGFSYEGETPTIEVDIHKHENSSLYGEITVALKQSSAFQTKLRVEDEMFSLLMPTEQFIGLNNSGSKEQQFETVHTFLKDCCLALARAL